MTDVVLYDYWRSSASYRLRIAMNLAGISYQSVSVDLLKGEHKTEQKKIYLMFVLLMGVVGCKQLTKIKTLITTIY